MVRSDNDNGVEVQKYDNNNNNNKEYIFQVWQGTNTNIRDNNGILLTENNHWVPYGEQDCTDINI